MQLNSTPVQVLPAKACNRCRLHGGIHAALGRSNSGTIIRLSRDRLSGRQAKQLKYVILSAATLSKTDQAAGTTSIPDTLRKYVAHVTVQGRQQPVHVYILGASHVSRQSCNHAAQVISATKPDIVLLELCKDRVDLLVDSSMPPPTHWHSRAVKLDSSFSQQSSFASTICTMLLERLKCRPGRPFAAYDIEQDCIQLLSSGMFASVTPSTQPASLSDAPMFVHDGNQMQTVAPLGSLHFQAVPRHLPQIASITITSSTDSSDRSQLAVDTASKESKQGTSTLDVLLKLHDQLQRGVKGHGSVSFSGVESGNIKVYVDTVSNPQEASVTGLEQTAISGKGWGISAFQPRTPQVPSLRNDCVSTSGSSTDRGASSTDGSGAAHWQPYSAAEIDAAQASASGRTSHLPSGLSNTFTNFVTQTYARYQREAGQAVGVSSGEAWRVAFQAAAQHGVSQVHLGDKPAIAMSQRMSAAITEGTVPYLGAALLLSLATVAAATTQALPPSLLPVPSVVTLAVLGRGLASILGPLLEIQKLSKMTPQEIEAAVDLSEPLQNGSSQLVKLWGEDALLDWPGALKPVIHERDAHMARTIHAAAQGSGGSPAYVADSIGAKAVWQYMMPQQPVESEACPKGHGSGVYFGDDNIQSIVAVVGTAHVRGIAAELEKL